MTTKLPPDSAVWQWMILPLRRYADFTGRSGRREFWFYCLFLLLNYIAVIVVLTIAIAILGFSPTGGAGPGLALTIGGFALVYIANFIPGLALSTRRLHDLGLSGWLLVAATFAILFLSIFGWIGYMVVMALPPQKHANQYGQPVGDEDMVQDVFA